MRTTEMLFPGVLLTEPTVRRDDRGYFWESYHSARYAELGIDAPFLPDNHSHSVRNVVRALHAHPGQDRPVTMIRGAISMRPSTFV
jgi:dTDP-4-dehydrorhamnose 3,5-epimerase